MLHTLCSCTGGLLKISTGRTCLQLRLVKSTVHLTGRPSEDIKTRKAKLLAGSSDFSSASASGAPEIKPKRPAPQTYYVAGTEANDGISAGGSTYSREFGVGQDTSALEAGKMSSPKRFNRAGNTTDGAPALPGDETYWGEAGLEEKEVCGSLASARYQDRCS